MRGTLALLILCLTGCARMEAASARMESPAYKQCEYEAAVATPGGSALRQVDLIQMCMRAKGL